MAKAAVVDAQVALPGRSADRGLNPFVVAGFLGSFVAVQVAWLGGLAYLVWLAWNAV